MTFIMLEKFKIAKYRLTFAPREEIILPALNKGNTLRGAFGAVFRNLVCIENSIDCPQCQTQKKCAYSIIFSPQIPEDATRLRKNKDIPRPFVIKPPLENKKIYKKNELLVFDIVLIGYANEYLPYFLVTFREMGIKGFGLNRAKAFLEKVETYMPLKREWSEIYDGNNGLVKNFYSLWTFDEIKNDANNLPKNHLTLHFLTPTRIIFEKQLIHNPDFHHIIKRLRDRINSLAVFYCNDELNIDYRQLGEKAEEIKTQSQHVFWQDLDRFSSRRNLTQDMSGFMGWTTYEGDLEEFLSILLLGEWVHVGKASLWGNGWIQMLRL